MSTIQETLFNAWHQATLLRHNLIVLQMDYSRRARRVQIARLIDRAYDREARRWFAFTRS